MKHDIIILLGILLFGCQSQSQQSDSESDDLLYEQYWQFQESMLFGIGDEDTAIESLFKSAEAGYAESQSQLGGCYAYRPDLIKREGADIDSAVIWWFKAAEQDSFIAQQELARYYAGKKDWKQAKYWMKQVKKYGLKDKELQKRINKNL